MQPKDVMTGLGFVTLLSCFLQSWCNSLASRTPVLLLLDLDTYGGVDPLGVSSIFKDGCGYHCSKIKHNFSWANPSRIVSGVGGLLM